MRRVIDRAIFVAGNSLGCRFFLPLWATILLMGSLPLLADETAAPSRAGNAEVEKVMREFKGKGQIGDGTQPLTPEDAMKHFQLDEGLQLDLVAAEPAIMQPLYMSFDAKGRMLVLQYRQYPFPAGLKIIRYDQYLRAIFDDVPRPPPHHVPGQDRVTIYEDTNGDGIYDAPRDIITGLNIATAALTGHGGIWVTNPPYLLFYPDADGDGLPDGDPQVRLRGFGLEDTHAVANSLAWGPDGWLYGAMGSTTTANISSHTTKNVHFEGQCIWRYHPQTDVFEVYAEGGGNTFSLEIDSVGRVFSGTNHGNTRGMYYPQGVYGEKNFGKHGPLTNPYAFGYIRHMAHQGDADRFPQTFVIYEGGALPERFNRAIIAANALHHRVWGSRVSRDGSTYQTVDMPNLCQTDDTWFRPVDVKVGPDGAVYLADWYDSRLSHVDPRDTWHKTSGRIYRLSSQGSTPQPFTDLTQLSDVELIQRFTHPNKWQQQTAVRVLTERLQKEAPAETLAKLHRLLTGNQAGALQALWVLSTSHQISETELAQLLSHPSEHVRRWAIRILGDGRTVTPGTARQLAKQAAVEPEIQVRSQFASSAKRFETSVALPILTALIQHSEDLQDKHLPLQIWWGLEAHCGTHVIEHDPQVGVSLKPSTQTSPREQVLAWLKNQPLWSTPIFEQILAARLMRRFALEGIQEQKQSPGKTPALVVCEQLLLQAPEAARPLLMSGFLEAYQGREIAALPGGLKQSIQDYQKSLGESDLVLGVRLGQEKAIGEALKVIRNEKADLATRLMLIETFGDIDVPRSVRDLQALLSSPSSGIKKAALQALMRYSDKGIATQICSRFQSTLPNEHGLREAAYRVLASRSTWAGQLLDEIEQNRLPASAISPDIIQQLRLHPDELLQKRINHLWGQTRETSAEKTAEIERLRQLIRNQTISDAAKAQGKQLFTKHCANCHTLFSEGGQIGPNLTGYERSNLDFLLLATVDPSAGIREEFTQFQVATEDGRVLTGLIVDQTPSVVTLRGANNQTTVIPREEIEILQAMKISLMPEGLFKTLSDEETGALFQYLMQPTPAGLSAAAPPPANAP